QGWADRARPRPARADCARGPGAGALLDHHAVQPARRAHGTARDRAARQAARHARAARGGRAGRGDGGAGGADGQRPRARAHPRGRARARRAGSRLRAAAPAARVEGSLARVAAPALPRPRRARDEPGPADARRQGLRPRLRHPHARRRPLRPTPPATLPQSHRPPRLHPPPTARRLEIRRPAETFAAARAFLTRITRMKADKPGSKCNGSRQPASSPRTTTPLSVLIGFYPRYPRQLALRFQPKTGSRGPWSQSHWASQALTRAMTAVRGRPTRRKSPKRYCPGPRISRLPWCPIGVRNATTAPSAVTTTNGVGG